MKRKYAKKNQVLHTAGAQALPTRVSKTDFVEPLRGYEQLRRWGFSTFNFSTLGSRIFML